MNKKTVSERKPDLLDPVHPRLEPAGESVNILSRVTEDIFRIQSAAGSAWLTEWLSDSVELFSPGGQNHLLQKMPELYQSQAERSVRVLFDAAEGLLRAQQELFEWQLQSFRKLITRS